MGKDVEHLEQKGTHSLTLYIKNNKRYSFCK